MKRPAFQFYPGDWRRDAALRSCSVAARGLWVDLMCLMHDGDPYGYLQVNGRALTDTQTASMVGLSLPVFRRLLTEVEAAGVSSRSDTGVLFSRRMVRDEEKRDEQAVSGKKGGSPKLGVEYNVPGYVYAMQRDSDGAVKIGISAQPAKRLYKVRQQFPSCVVSLIAASYTDDMGRDEAALHRLFSTKSMKGGEWFALTDAEQGELVSRLKANNKGSEKGEAPPAVAVASASAPAEISTEQRQRPRGIDGPQFARLLNRMPETGHGRGTLAQFLERLPADQIDGWVGSLEALLDGQDVPASMTPSPDHLATACRDYMAAAPPRPNPRHFRAFVIDVVRRAKELDAPRPPRHIAQSRTSLQQPAPAIPRVG